jgi:ribonuclease BN (tRNA processing enzyme)
LRTTSITVALALAAALHAAPAQAQTCADSQLAVQILGSGGPFPTGSASSGYLIWSSGRSIALVDAGGGVFQRFGQAGARLEQLELVAISHLHPDHVSDLAALLWLSDRRPDSLVVAGPSGDAVTPPFDVFLDRLAGASGALPALAGRNAPLSPVVVDADAAAVEPTIVLDTGSLRVSALGVPHGVPTLAYRVTVDGVSVVFGSDQNGLNPAFAEFAVGADALVMHLALASGTPPAPLGAIHATPAVVGQVAAATNVGGLVLSHVIEPPAGYPPAAAFSGFDNDTLMAAVQEVRQSYGGQIAVAQDLQCVVIQP